MIYGRHLVTLQFQDNDDLVIASTLLPSSPVSDAVSWSSDESQLAFQDWRGDIWIADLLGKAQQIPGAASVPQWSADGNWISYCSEDNALWVFGGGNQPVKIAENSTCGGQWSPSRNILAYTASDAPDDEIRDAALYDVEQTLGSPALFK